jgi:hypothetical protein
VSVAIIPFPQRRPTSFAARDALWRAYDEAATVEDLDAMLEIAAQLGRLTAQQGASLAA